MVSFIAPFCACASPGDVMPQVCMQANIPLNTDKSAHLRVFPIAGNFEVDLRDVGALCARDDRVNIVMSAGLVVLLTFELDSDAQRVRLARQQTIRPRGIAPPPRKFASLTCRHSTLLLSGGHASEGGHLFRDVWEFDLERETWQCLWDKAQSPAEPIPAPFCAHSTMLLDSDTLVAIGGWPSLTLPHAFWAFRLSTRTWYPIVVNMKLRTGPITEIRTPRGIVDEGILQVVVGGGFGTDVRTSFITLKKDSTTGTYQSLDPIIGLQTKSEIRIAASQVFYNDLQITLGGLRPTKSALFTVLDVFNDRFLFQGDPFSKHSVPLSSVNVALTSPFAHALPSAVVRLPHSPTAGILDYVPAAVMLTEGLGYVRTTEAKKMIKFWLAQKRPSQNIDSCVQDHPLVRFLKSAPDHIISSILPFL
eukprot:Gregarina_sp_Pseudo_9__5350@NODE_638_length_2440_cov_27_670554_g602_i0_p1_GENE_NODE_638_length_2440_cov_27_670554_g602_i0NODE_638_length_2440_cov_27_670554_g602_i0_p1_ORF_typecomplete_len420_score90_78Kelch_4/PF13418_6/4_3e05Kelch_4/PF13418_6/0_011Kelch_4/PF13418_6/1_7e04Kelch_3/PF13415_6/1_2e02Kelch_3/PF13415_6/3_2e05Kelch_3/PF13415_6/3_1Kelch_6/PF13964_6/0_034Kelch_6/PF13964_6/0_061Kelch_6/PF13964_6/8_4e03Kelch_2/PF07646_15/0_0009Kelch_2/PF07646_15/17Kelch_1/PF01344_25/0_6Kelch_1/PF01344_25/35